MARITTCNRCGVGGAFPALGAPSGLVSLPVDAPADPNGKPSDLFSCGVQVQADTDICRACLSSAVIAYLQGLLGQSDGNIVTASASAVKQAAVIVP